MKARQEFAKKRQNSWRKRQQKLATRKSGSPSNSTAALEANADGASRPPAELEVLSNP